MVRGKFQMVWIFRNTQISKISNKPLDTRHYLVLLVEENLPVKKRESKKWVSDLKKSQILQPNINKSPYFEMDPYCVILLKPLLFLQQKIIFSTSTIPRNPWGTPEGNMTQTFFPAASNFLSHLPLPLTDISSNWMTNDCSCPRGTKCHDAFSKLFLNWKKYIFEFFSTLVLRARRGKAFEHAPDGVMQERSFDVLQ